MEQSAHRGMAGVLEFLHKLKDDEQRQDTVVFTLSTSDWPALISLRHAICDLRRNRVALSNGIADGVWPDVGNHTTIQLRAEVAPDRPYSAFRINPCSVEIQRRVEIGRKQLPA